MMGNKNGFVNDNQELMWDAFSGKCGNEFKGNPFFMEGFMEYEFMRTSEKEDLGREL